MIFYPAPLKKGDLIGITAPSAGVTGVIGGKMDNAQVFFCYCWGWEGRDKAEINLIAGGV